METVKDLILWGSKITTNGDCSQEIKRCLLLGRKVMTNLDSIFKSRDFTLPTKVRLVKAIYCHPAYLTYMQSTGIKIARRTINNLRYADDTTLMEESEEELKSLLMNCSEAITASQLKALSFLFDI